MKIMTFKYVIRNFRAIYAESNPPYYTLLIYIFVLGLSLVGRWVQLRIKYLQVSPAESKATQMAQVLLDIIFIDTGL